MRRKLLVIFFLFMMGCTVISRIYDSITIPKVVTTTAKKKAVETRVEGTGTVTVKEKRFCQVVPEIRIRQTAVIPGSQVEENDTLFWYDMESLSQKISQLKGEIEQIDLNMEKERISQEYSQGLTQEEAARWELEFAMRELETGQAEFQESEQEHLEKLDQLKENYERDLSLAEDELWRQQELDWETTRQELDNIRNSRDEAIRQQERKIEDLEEELDSLSSEEEDKRTDLEKQLSRAVEDLEEIGGSWEERVDTARFQLELLDRQEDRIRSGQTSVQEARRESYESALQLEEDRMKAAAKDLETLKKAVERAQWQLETARKEDYAVEASREQQKRISDLTIRELELNKKEKEKELAVLEELEAAEGEMRSPADGVVADLEITEGKMTDGQELVSLTVGGTWFEGTFLKEEQNLVAGDALSITVPGVQKPKEAVINRINLLGETKGIFQAELGEGDLPLGTVTAYVCTRQSDIFNKVIPLEGLRKDMKGYYCLVSRPVSTILGEEFRAVRVEVQVLFQGSSEAAIEGSVFDEDRVIVQENKTINEGDRIRPVSGF